MLAKLIKPQLKLINKIFYNYSELKNEIKLTDRCI
jgi:hypothetical protein